MLYECLTITTIFGITPLLEKYVLQFIEAETMVLLSVFLLFVFCATYLYLFENRTRQFYRDLQKMNQKWELYGLVLLIAVALYIVANYFYLAVIAKHKTYMVTTLTASYPIITVILGYLFLGEDITPMHMVGVLMIILGVVFLNS